MPPPGARSGYTGFALCGALLGAMLVLALKVWNIPSGRFVETDPFTLVMAETIGFATFGAVLSALLGLLQRQFLHRM